MTLRALLGLGLLAAGQLALAEDTAATAAPAAEPAATTDHKLDAPTTVLATRGDAFVIVQDIDAFAAQVPARDRSAVVATEERVTTLLQNLLLNRQLANEATKLGLDKDPVAQREIQIATEKVLARRALEHHVQSQKQPNLEQLARETYLSDKSKFMSPMSRRVQHILINNKERSDPEARALIDKIAAEVAAPGADFDALVMQYSEDPGKGNNKGYYPIDDTMEGKMDPAFLAAAKGLSKVGEVTEPVNGMFGYHLIKLTEDHPPRQLSFDEVRAQLMEQLRAAWQKRVQDEHTETLRQQPAEIDVEAAKELPNRYRLSPLAPN